jgi:heat shock protein HslJ
MSTTLQVGTGSGPETVFPGLVQPEKLSLLSPPIMVRILTAITILVATLIIVACGSSSPNDLAGSAWDLALLSGNGLLSDTAITIEFLDDKISGSAGCNHYAGDYQASGDNLVFGELVSTEMACPEPAGILEQESAYLAALDLADAYQLNGDRLEILDEADGLLLEFVAQDDDFQAETPQPTEESVTVSNQTVTMTPQPDPTPTTATVAATPSPTTGPPPGFVVYEDPTAGVALFLPDTWVVSYVDPGRWAILQSYGEDKYVGGEGLQPGDTKCDLNIREPGTKAGDLIQQWRSDPDAVILSEQELTLDSGATGTRLEVDNRGRSLSMIIDVHGRAVVLTCFGEFEPFDAIAMTLHPAD